MGDYGDWWAAPGPAAGGTDPAVAYGSARRRRRPGRWLAGMLAGALALAIALTGGSVIVDHDRRQLSTAALPGTSSTAADASARKSAHQSLPVPRKTVAPAPVLSVAQVAATVEPGVVIINSQLDYQNAEAAGTGIVLSAGGVVLTNNHVIAGASSIKVTVIATGRQYTAEVVGTAVSNDVAVLQLQGASGLATAPIGDSAEIRVGQSVVAIGNAGGQGSLTVVSGDVTSTDRTITASDETGSSSERLTGMIEVQAPIRAGDSGGPLSDRAGRVIGMDTAASASQGGIQTGPTVGFAIPIDRAIAIAGRIRSGVGGNGTQIGSRGYLGIQVTSAAGGGGGAQVIATNPGSPAGAAGIGPGDTITYLNGTPVASSDELTNTLLQSKPGQTVTVGWTDQFGDAHSAQVTLTSGPAD